MRVALLGATGAAGRELLPLLLARGCDVRASVRSEAAAAGLAALGAQPVRSDIVDQESLRILVRGCDAVLNLASAVPRPAGSWHANDLIRRRGTRALLAACAREDVPRIVQMSVAMLHCADDRQPQDESSPLVGAGVLRSALDMEREFARSGLDGRIVRGGLFYGPGTGQPGGWCEALTHPAFRIPGDGGGWLSPVHVSDFAAAMLHALEAGIPRAAWIACDDRPLRWRELFAALAERAGRPVPPTGGAATLASFRTSNARLKSLGWRPRFALLDLPCPPEGS